VTGISMIGTLFWKERSSWPTHWPRFQCEPDDPILEQYAERLLREYSAVRCYHGTRPISVSSYYLRGIQVPEYHALERRARRLFCGPSGLGVDEALLKSIVRDIGPRDKSQVHLALDDRWLLRRAGHYLIYGSEYLQTIAGRLPPKFNPCFDRLKRIGTPTVFVVDLPTKWISPPDLRQLAFTLGQDRSEEQTPKMLDFTITLYRTVPQRYIVGHHHPERIWDPFHWCDYTWKAKSRAVRTDQP
jgi:hypothetical protein